MGGVGEVGVDIVRALATALHASAFPPVPPAEPRPSTSSSSAIQSSAPAPVPLPAHAHPPATIPRRPPVPVGSASVYTLGLGGSSKSETHAGLVAALLRP